LFQENRLAIPSISFRDDSHFVYVGVEVSTASNLPAYMEQHLDFNSRCSSIHFFILGEFNDWSLDRAVEAFY
jgi:fucose permease